MEKIGCLWLNISTKKEKYLSGIIYDKKVVIFKNKSKKDKKSPDLLIYLKDNTDEDEGSNKNKSKNNSFNFKESDDLPF